jgi:hypothetical protein
MKLTIESFVTKLSSDDCKYTFKIPEITSVKKITGIKLSNETSLIENVVIKLVNNTIYKSPENGKNGIKNGFLNLDIPFNIRDNVYIEFVYNKDYLYDNETYETIPEIIEEYGEIVEIYDETDGSYYNGNIVTRKDTGNTQRIVTKGAEIVVPKFKIYFE